MNNHILNIISRSNNQVLSLSNLQINDSDLETIVHHIITKLPNLEYLNLSKNHLTHKSIDSIDKLLSSDHLQLKFLNLNHNKIGAEGIINLSKLLKDSSLESLRIDNNNIGPLGALAILSELKNNDHRLHLLSLKHNYLTPYLSLQISQFSKEQTRALTIHC